MDTSPTRLLIHGASGRMGQALLRLAAEHTDTLIVVGAYTGRAPAQRVVDGIPQAPIEGTSFAYTFDKGGALDGTRIRLGVNNLFDVDPPLADDTYGFFSALHSPRGRVFRVDIRKTF